MFSSAVNTQCSILSIHWYQSEVWPHCFLPCQPTFYVCSSCQPPFVFVDHVNFHHVSPILLLTTMSSPFFFPSSPCQPHFVFSSPCQPHFVSVHHNFWFTLSASFCFCLPGFLIYPVSLILFLSTIIFSSPCQPHFISVHHKFQFTLSASFYFCPP